MQFIKTLFWVILAVILVVFAANNWSPTSVLIWEDVRIDTKLPVLVIGAFLAGFVPLWIIHRASKWRLNRRIKTLETAARPAPAPTPSSGPTPSPATTSAVKSEPVAAPPSAASKPAAPLDLNKDQIAKTQPAVSPIETDKNAGDKAAGA